MSRYPKKRRTAHYLESSVSENTYSQGKTPAWRQLPPLALAFWDTYGSDGNSHGGAVDDGGGGGGGGTAQQTPYPSGKRLLAMEAIP